MARVNTGEATEKALIEAGEWIAAGQINKARLLVTRCAQSKNARPHLHHLANLARRSGVPHIAIRLLNPIVRPGPRSTIKPNDFEKAEYGAALSAIGATWEAEKLLGEVDGNEIPQSLLYRAFVHFSQWNYAKAIPLLKEYLASNNLDDYQRCIGKLNLVAAFVVEGGHLETAEQLEDLRQLTQLKRFQRLYANSLELSAQYFVSERDWTQAKHFVSEAEKNIQKGTLDSLFVEKWRAATELLKGSLNGTKLLYEVRKRAQVAKHWETVRECDLIEGVAKNDLGLLSRLYFGTPYLGYRQRIFYWMRAPFQIPESFRLGRGKDLDISLAEIDGARFSLKPGQALHQLLTIIVSDFYRPFRLATIHSQLFGDTYYNPVSSPARVHQLIKRLRKCLSSARIPLAVVEDDKAYHFELKKGLCLLLRREGPPTNLFSIRISELRSKYGKEEFSISQIVRDFGYSNRTVLRLLNQAIEEKEILREGFTNSTRYRFSH